MPLHDFGRGLHAAMAGSGNPYSVLTPDSLALCLRLHDGERIAAPHPTLDALVAQSLLSVQEGFYRPEFFIANYEEAARIDRHARDVGLRMADRLLARWSIIEAAYDDLAVSARWPFADLAFFLVGDRILDVGLLAALAADRSLMPPAPARPSPTEPAARYYFWLIEGDADLLGRYGQRATPLPWPGWSLITYGQYQIGPSPNVARDELEAAVSRTAKQQATDPHSLATALTLPLLDHADARRWAAVEREATAELLALYHDTAPALRTLYASTKAGRIAPERFGEFFCWYDHVAYAHAIDALVAAGAMTLPADRFTAALWCEVSDSAF